MSVSNIQVKRNSIKCIVWRLKFEWRPILPVTFECNYNGGPIVLILPNFFMGPVFVYAENNYCKILICLGFDHTVVFSEEVASYSYLLPSHCSVAKSSNLKVPFYFQAVFQHLVPTKMFII